MTKPGLVYFKGKYRPFTEFREIQRGKNSGRIEIQLRETLQSGKGLDRTWAWRSIPRIIAKSQIHRYPEEVNALST